MAIQNVGSIGEILKRHDTNQWLKSADIEKAFDVKGDIGAGPIAHEKNMSFSELLADSIMDVNSLQKEANLAIEKLATGKSKNLHETMLAVERADIAFRSMNQIRKKVIEAYKEVMRMQI